jgi:diguanylate cyclase (GGDEF)-like protein
MPMPEESMPRHDDPNRKLLAAGQAISACRCHEELLTTLECHLPALTECCHWRLWMCDELTGNWRQASGEKTLPEPTVTELSRLVAEIAGDSVPRFTPGKKGAATYWLPLPVGAELAGILEIEPGTNLPNENFLLHLEDLAPFLGQALELTALLCRLHEQNIKDDLTGLFNARHFRKLIDYELERARRYGNDLSLVFIDLDFFKKVNDTHGHLVGSQLLTEVGHFIQEHTRRVNLACRYGGDEFVLLLPSTGKAGAMVLAEKLRSDICRQQFQAGARVPVEISASFGVASYPGDARSTESLIRLADEAMYRVKASGRNGVASC